MPSPNILSRVPIVGVLAATVLGLSTLAAAASDLPQVYRKAPELAPIPYAPTWTGFYFGGNAGYATGHAEESYPGFLTTTSSIPISGGIGGTQAGFLYQFGGWVLGAEASVSSSSMTGRGNDTLGLPCAGGVTDCRITAVDWLTMVDARGGLAYGSWLIYASGGFAGARVSSDQQLLANGSLTAVDQVWHKGWNVGGGVEFAYSNHVAVGLEYKYVDLGSARHGAAFPIAFQTDIHPEFHVIRARVDFKMNP